MHGRDRMDKAEFQKSKDDILGWISNLIGVEPEQLRGRHEDGECPRCGALSCFAMQQSFRVRPAWAAETRFATSPLARGKDIVNDSRWDSAAKAGCGRTVSSRQAM